MHLTTRNVNTAFRELVDAITNGDGYFPTTNDLCPVVRRPSRNGPVLTIDEPVTVTYTHPRERVLFNAGRDANPFFHLYEALWMLAGRNDVAPVAYYAKQMREYSDDGKTLNGAYGYRWRQWEWNRPAAEYLDQLDLLVEHLRGEPTSRRAVLQMWSPEFDLLQVGYKRAQFGKYRDWPSSKDVCCNLSVMFSIREVEGISTPADDFLDMTVTNRSNDLIWGMLGANYVHFTILQEYLAARLGVEVGRYHHFTNNLHVYETRSDWKPAELLADNLPEGLGRYEGNRADPLAVNFVGTGAAKLNTVPLVRDPAAFEEELPRFVEHFSGKFKADELGAEWAEPFLADVAAPLLIAWACHKERAYHSAFGVGAECTADDWRVAAESWLRRRADRVEGK
jgi:thymidylate synthase